MTNMKARLRRIFLVICTVTIASNAGLPSASAQDPSDIPIEAFAQLPAISNGSLSPTGRYFMTTRLLNGETSLVIEDLYGELPPFIIPPMEGFEIEYGLWATDTRFLFVVSNIGLYRYTNNTASTNIVKETRLLAGNVDQTNVIPIIKPSRLKQGGASGRHAPPKFQSDIIDMMWDDPEHILVAIDGDHDGRDEVRQVNINDGSFREIQRGMLGMQQMRTDYNGEIRYGYGVVPGRADSTVQIIRPAGGGDYMPWEDTAAGQEGASFLGFTKENPNVLYVVKHYLDKPGELWLYDLENDEMVEMVFADEKYEGIGLVEHTYGQRVVGYSITRDYLEIEYTDETYQQVQRLVDAALPNTANLITSANRDLTIFSVYSRSGSQPGTYYVLDYANKQLIPWGSRYENLDPNLMAEVKKVQYPARDGTMLDAYLFIPHGSDGKNMKTIVMPHGGPHARDTMDFDYWAQFMASRGFAIIQPQFRGTEGYNLGFEDAGRNQWGLLMQDDVTDATKWMISEGLADPERTCIIGWSYGGYAALMGVIKEPDLYKCAASINGVTDLPRLIRHLTEFIGGHRWARSIGGEASGDILIQTSPARRAGEIKVPLLLVQSEDDLNVPEEQLEYMVHQLEQNDVEFDVVMTEDGQHSLVTSESRFAMMTALERFLRSLDF